MSIFRRPYTQTDARAALLRAAAGLKPPRVIHAEPDGREQMDNPRLKPRTLAEWQRRHGKRGVA